eukprot:353241-Chlamydomonas_euryale.AAC.9
MPLNHTRNSWAKHGPHRLPFPLAERTNAPLCGTSTLSPPPLYLCPRSLHPLPLYPCSLHPPPLYARSPVQQEVQPLYPAAQCGTRPRPTHLMSQAPPLTNCHPLNTACVVFQQIEVDYFITQRNEAMDTHTTHQQVRAAAVPRAGRGSGLERLPAATPRAGRGAGFEGSPVYRIPGACVRREELQ